MLATARHALHTIPVQVLALLQDITLPRIKKVLHGFPGNAALIFKKKYSVLRYP